MEERAYEDPVARLLELGDVRELRERPDYLGLGLGPEHTEELIRMALDDDLSNGDSDSPDVWAPVHAWRALGELRAEEAAEPLLLVLDQEDDDWVSEEMPDVFGKIGPAAIPALSGYLGDRARYLWGRVNAAVALEKIGTNFPESRDACVEALARELKRFRRNDEGLNGFLVSGLIDLRAPEAAPMIEAAFAAGYVDPTVVGDWPTVRKLLNLPDEADRSLAWHTEPAPAEVPLTRAQRRAAERKLRKVEKAIRRL